ncbi:uncharacterized protein J8A68_003105 [[Candida] subhashii]|uniref:THUMP domain-containing protein n=1 Tax=[Candida] subhashii TaxID=561895 RepID=A0A8J5QHZ5_9ASCO|nr:uncharacterized protein J8A68_003105 [[Candida] subhashii]KAG7663357.1 hypothetical protein J8A68_003105 [[Candida] subhashii]
MGKRRGGSSDGGNAKKRYKKPTNVLLDPNTSGIYATCNRNKEKACKQELMLYLQDKIEELYKVSELEDEEDEDESSVKEELSIEDKLQQELNEMKESSKNKTNLLTPIDIDCECLVFIKTKKPIDPEELVEKVCEESYESTVKRTRYTQKLSPVMDSCSASKEELQNLTRRVLARHFHQSEDQKPIKFAININKRNFNTLNKDQMIKAIAECVGNEHGHKVDLKDYDKLILVECFKNNIGMSVVNNYQKYNKYNLQQIYEKKEV